MNKNDLLKLLEQFKDEIKNQTDHVMIDGEGILIFQKLKILVQGLGSSQQLSGTEISSLLNLFEQRSAIINATGDYCSSPDSAINRLLEKIVKQLRDDYGYNVNETLMPNVQFSESTKDLKFHQFIISKKEYNGSLIAIPIGICIDSMISNRGSMKFKANGQTIFLTDEDSVRISHHSLLASNYVRASLIAMRNNGDVLDEKQQFWDLYESENYFILKNYHGETGDKRLGRIILDQIKNIEKFTNFLIELPVNSWQRFFKIVPPSDLIYILLPGISLGDRIKKISYDEHDLKLKANCFSLLEVYWQSRKEGSRYNTNLGFFSGKINYLLGGRYLPVSPIEDKEICVNALCAFLVSNESFNLRSVKGKVTTTLDFFIDQFFTNYLRETNIILNDDLLLKRKNDLWLALQDDAFGKLIKDDTLVKIYEQMNTCCYQRNKMDENALAIYEKLRHKEAPTNGQSMT